MKRILATILAILYLSTSMGATLHLHYCMGKLVAFGLSGNESHACEFCGMPKKTADKDGIKKDNGCCKDEQKQVKASDDQKLTQPLEQGLKLFSVLLINSFGFSSAAVLINAPVKHPPANGPPQTGSIPFFLLNCNFRI